MRKVLHKVKSQWIVLGVLGATVVSLGTADVRQVSASEIEGSITSESIAVRELGTADVLVEAAEKAAHIGLENAISTTTTDGTATVFVHWNEDGTITVTVKGLNGSVLYSSLLVDTEGENTIKVLTANQDYYTIDIAVNTVASEVETVATESVEQAIPAVQIPVVVSEEPSQELVEEIPTEENNYANIVSTTDISYSAVITRTTDAINTAPWGVQGYQTLASSADYAGKTVDVTKEQVTDYGVTWALVSLNGKELGWIAKDALVAQTLTQIASETYAQIVSETAVDYSATISRGTDAINTAPWGVSGYQNIGSSTDYVGRTVDVSKEQVTDYGVTWALVTLDGQELGWIAKDALTVQTYSQIVSETIVEYPATISRGTDAINTAPWGAKGYQTISSSAAYVGKTVAVSKEQVTDYGVTWALVSLDGLELGWIAKDALTVQSYAQIVSETIVEYPATISRGTDAINTAPWGAKGYYNIGSSADYVGKIVDVSKEQVTDYDVTWSLVSLDGKELGWIAKNALTVLERTTKTVVENKNVVTFKIVNQEDSTLPIGESEIVQAGSDGFDSVTYEVNYTNGIEVSRTEVGRETTDAVNEIIRIGTKVVETKTETATENKVTYTIVEQEDDTLPTGERKIVQKGSNGYETVSYEVTYTNGLETNRLETSRQTIQSVDEIVKVGTQITESKMETVTENTVNAKLIEITDSTIPTGERKVIQSGRNGYDKVTYAVTYTNGNETNRTEVSRKTITALNEIVIVGTQVVETKTAVATENEVAYTTEEQSDPTLLSGKREVVQIGSAGFDTVTYAITYTNGLETGRVRLNSVTTAPVNEVVKVGTRVVEKKAETVEVINGTAPETIEIADSSLLAGERIVIQKGVNGYDLVTYEVIYTNGSETGRTEIDRESISSVNEVIKTGTKIVETKTKTVTENEKMFTTTEQLDDTMMPSEREVIQAGSKGYDTVTYELTYVNGVQTSRIEVARDTTNAVEQIVKVGTKVVEIKIEKTSENAVAHTLIEIVDNTIPSGEKRIVQEGMDGYDTVTYEVTITNGAETGRVEVYRDTVAAVTEIIKIGTQVVEKYTETATENIMDYSTAIQWDDTLPTGEKQYDLIGVNGYDTVTYEVTYVNGLAVSRELISRVTTNPVNEIVRIGTQVTESKTEVVTENEVTFVTIEQEDNTLPTGTREIIQVGSNGYDLATYVVTYTNGAPTNYLELSRETIAPVNETVKVGTQVIETRSEATTENIIGYTTFIEEDATLSADESIVYQTGANGFDAVTYEVTYTNGVETNRVEVSRQRTAPQNQIVKVGTKVSVNTIAVTSEDSDSIILNGSTLQMAASISPDDATATEVTWSVEAGTGTATIDSTGLLTAMSAGTVIVKATANDGSGIVGSQLIEIAVPVSIVRYNGSDLDVMIPELIDGSQAISSYGYINNYGYTYYYTNNGFDLLGGLEYGKKGIVTSLDNSAFGWKQLTTVVIPDSVTNIGSTAFYGNQLTSIVLPEGLISIGNDAFGQNQLTSIDIPNSVVSIGSAAFYGNQLSSVNLPDNLISIGENVFGYNQLTNIDIPNSVLSIGSSAFQANHLIDVIIPSSVTSIGAGAFYGNQLTSITIPDSITSIENSAFNGNQLISLEIPNSVQSIGNDAFSNNQLVSILLPEGLLKIENHAFSNNQLIEINLPDTLTSIGDYAFYNNQLVSVDIPAGVINIGTGTFYNNQLISVNMPEGLTSIGESAFSSNNGYSYGTNQLTSVTIPSTVTKIGAYAFNNNRLINVLIPNGVINIDQYAFYGNQLTSVILSESLTSIGSYAFGNNQLSSVTIPSAVTKIGAYAFNNNRLTNMNIPEGVTSIGEYAFSWNQLTNVVIPKTMKIIGDYAFYYNQLTNVLIPAGVTRIEDYAFGSNQLTKVVLPDSLTSIGNNAFNGNRLTSIAIPKGVTIIGTNAFSSNQLTHIIIPDSVKVIGSSAFTGNQISTITLGVEVQIGENVLTFDNKFREAYKIGGAGTYILTQNGEWMKVAATKEIEFISENMVDYSTKIEEDLSLAADESKIFQVGIAGYDTVTYEVIYIDGAEISRVEVNRQTISPVNQIIKVGKKVEVSNITVTSAEDKSLILRGDTLQMGAVVLPGDANLMSVIWSVENGTGAATIDSKGLLTTTSAGTVTVKATASDGSGVIGIKIIEIAVPLTIINYNGSNLDIIIPDIINGSQAEPGGYTSYYTYNGFGLSDGLEYGNKGIVTSVGAYAFYANQITNITIPDSVTNIGEYAFYGDQLTKLIIPESVTNIGAYAFANNQLVSLTLAEGVTSIGDNAFTGNKLMNVVIPTSVESIGYGAFQNNQLLSVVIPEGITNIGSFAFYDNQLTSIDIPEGVTSIGSYAFSGNNYSSEKNGYGNQLTNVIIPSSVTSIGDYAFSRNKLTSLVIPEGVMIIGSYAFYNNQLTSVVIPASVTSIGDSAFENNRLTSVVIPEGVTTIGNRAFYDNQLTNVDIPASVASIGSYAFYNNRLTSVTIPEGVTNIGSYAFYNNQLTSVYIPDSVTTIGNNAFENNMLSSVEISKGVTSIGTQVFNNNALTSVVIPEGVISIGNNSFSNNQLSSAVIPNTVSTIGTSAFYNNGLTEIVIPDSVTIIGSYAFQDNLLTSIVIPEGVTFIGNGALSQNQFTSITIGSGVQIGDNLLGMNNNFRTAYTTGGAGTYTGTQDGEWTKISE